MDSSNEGASPIKKPGPLVGNAGLRGVFRLACYHGRIDNFPTGMLVGVR